MRDDRTDHYRVLQVHPSANPLVIQAAYRVLARIFHPDVEGDDEQMKRINRAWEVLGDPRRRAQYDNESAGRHPGPAVSTGFAASTAAPSPPAPAKAWSDDHAGPPQGQPFGPVLTFGRYEGWSLGQIARMDRPFLEWLRRVPAGRALRDEIDAVLRSGGMDGVDRRRYERDGQRVHTWAPGAPTKVR
jgi:curved DNA-binding protein CbpA